MRRFTVLLSLTLLQMAGAHPVPKAAQTSLVGTTWTGTSQWGSEAMAITITFEAGGRLRYHDDLKVPGTWSKEGSTVRWCINNYSHFEVELNGRSMNGTARNDGKQTATVGLSKTEPQTGKP